MGVERRDFLPRNELEQLQLARLRDLLAAVLPQNGFHQRRLAGLEPQSICCREDLGRLPLLTKNDLLAHQRDHPPYGRGLTHPLARYVRLFQTSGTSGQPLRWLDTPGSLAWMYDCWEQMFAVAGLTPQDRLFFPFSFGPFLGFWTA